MQKAESSALSSLRPLLEDDSGCLSQQATSPQDQEPLGSPRLSEVGSQYLPFFCIYEQPLAVEELTQPAEVCPGHEAACSCREDVFPEDSAPPDGFFPYYRSQEECLPSATPPGCWYLGSREPLPGSRAQDGCCKVTARDGCPSSLAGPDLNSGLSPSPACCPFLGGFMCEGDQDAPLPRDHVLGASGFVPYYRSPEERLHISPTLPCSGLGSSQE
ncbi:uncharacterized protein LOC110557063 [Meriones unguiculatus]|uniref:uncharacterized protein LOC110557063 n=1 Tax=Meriones unguiculatus TaxID=10047 RepID=UPI000B4E956A|nr:uncharacterized protein LOC110557063 [Meriones unguiculatus]